MTSKGSCCEPYTPRRRISAAASGPWLGLPGGMGAQVVATSSALRRDHAGLQDLVEEGADVVDVGGVDQDLALHHHLDADRRADVDHHVGGGDQRNGIDRG